MVEEHKHHEVHEHKDKMNNTTKILAVMIGILLLFAVYNGYKISNIKQTVGGGSTSATNTNAFASIIPTGIPVVYGAELDVSYDDVSARTPQKADATIGKLGNLDRTLTLSGDNLKRYVAIGSKISCEYCCGAASIIFKDGTPACGCAHSYAMRGLAKYLLTKHGSEFSDEQILEELGKWKVLFFPDVHMQKASILKSKGTELNYINLASNLYRGIEQGASGGSMVGGC